MRCGAENERVHVGLSAWHPVHRRPNTEQVLATIESPHQDITGGAGLPKDVEREPVT